MFLGRCSWNFGFDKFLGVFAFLRVIVILRVVYINFSVCAWGLECRARDLYVHFSDVAVIPASIFPMGGGSSSSPPRIPCSGSSFSGLCFTVSLPDLSAQLVIMLTDLRPVGIVHGKPNAHNLLQTYLVLTYLKCMIRVNTTT